MPKSRVKRSKLFRDFSFLPPDEDRPNYLKNYKRIISYMSRSYGISSRQVLFLVHCYDLEFWTIDYICKSMGESRNQVGIKVIYPLAREGYVYKHFDKLTPSQTLEDHLFRDETKTQYRVRYAITQKARLLVSRFYRILEGKERPLGL